MRNRKIFEWVAIVWLGASALPAAAGQTVSGPAAIVDGDTFEIDKTRIRLFGVDAFEGTQICGQGGKPWKCGIEARGKLRALIGAGIVTCDKRDTDSYNRTVAVCRSGAVDLGAEMVRSGLALAYRQFSDDYVDEEKEARNARRGAWAGDFTAPWDYRHQLQTGGGRSARYDNGVERSATAQPRSETPAVAQSPPQKCLIKGNISYSNGERIYHLPGWRDYDSTKIDPLKGERWFCTEAEARAAGWRPGAGS